MSVIIRAHFDGKAIVPDSQIDLPSDQPLEVEVRMLAPAGKTTETPKATTTKGMDITTTPFFGMWADRTDMADSVVWVREERAKWSNQPSGTD